MFKANLTPNSVTVETGNAKYIWDSAKGGILSGMVLKESNNEHTMISPENMPELCLNADGREICLSNYKTEFQEVYRENSYIIFTATTKVDDILTFEQQYEVCEESAVFCEFRIMINEGTKVRISNVSAKFSLDTCSADKIKMNYMSRDLYIKQDVTVPHILGTVKVALDKNEVVAEKHIIPLVGVDLGWNKTRHYSNRVELIMEDSTSFGNNMLGNTSTVAKIENGTLVNDWKLAENIDEEFESPFFYRNKWAIFCGSARTESGQDVDPVKRNNALGARICHVMYPYVYAERNWPWSSVPLKQCFYQDVQLAGENPGLERIDEAIELGANILIIHQFWMSCGGSNGEPMSSYQAHDPEWLKAFIDKAHDHGMRVLLYVRGIEQYLLYADFFDKYLIKDWDGMYMDWAAPFLMGFCKSTVKHSSVHNWFMFMRAVREKIGRNGLLIGHTIMQTAVSYSLFDVALTGEFSVLHSGLLGKPEISTSYGGQSCCGLHLIAGNAPDRRAFSSQKAVAYAAALGWANHPFMEPGFDFEHSCGFTKSLWDLINCLESDPVKIFNPTVEQTEFAEWNNDALYPVAYIDKNGNALIIITNLSENSVAGEVTINLPELGLETGEVMNALEIAGTHSAKVDGNKVIIESMDSYLFCGIFVKGKNNRK